MVIFCQDEVAQSNDDIMGYFLLQQFSYIFTQKSSFKKRLVIGLLRFPEWFYLDILDFLFEL